LIHDGATNSTNAPSFDPEGVALFRCQVIAAASDELLATLNFGEYIFHSLRVNKGKGKGRIHSRPYKT
jgi:hypothetical protein